MKYRRMRFVLSTQAWRVFFLIDVQKPSVLYSTERRKKNHQTDEKKKRRETTIEEGDFDRFQTIAVTATKGGQNSKPTNQRK